MYFYTVFLHSFICTSLIILQSFLGNCTRAGAGKLKADYTARLSLAKSLELE